MRYILILLLMLFLVGCLTPVEDDITQDDTLELLWAYPYSMVGWGGRVSPGVVGDSLVLMTGDEYITCLRADSGSIKWRYDVPGDFYSFIGSFLFDDQQLYAWEKNDGYSVYTLDMATGELNWSIDSCGRSNHHGIGPNYYSPFYKSAFKISKSGQVLDTVKSDQTYDSMSYFNGRVYGSIGWSPPNNPNSVGRIICYNEETMDSLWTHEEPGGGFDLCYPVFEDGVMYIGTIWGAKNKTLALNAETGEVIWDNNNYGAIKMIIVGDVLYRKPGAAVFAMNKTTGEDLWRTNLSNPDERPTMSYLDGFLYVENYGTLFILNAETGEIVHKVYGGPDGAGIEQVSTGAGKVFIQTSRHLYAFNPFNPELKTNE